jgi:hypothetical protein
LKLDTNENLKTVFYCYYSVDELITEKDLEEQAYIDYEAGCYSNICQMSTYYNFA